MTVFLEQESLSGVGGSSGYWSDLLLIPLLHRNLSSSAEKDKQRTKVGVELGYRPGAHFQVFVEFRYTIKFELNNLVT